MTPHRRAARSTPQRLAVPRDSLTNRVVAQERGTLMTSPMRRSPTIRWISFLIS
jgi:hypothetical protein